MIAMASGKAVLVGYLGILALCPACKGAVEREMPGIITPMPADGMTGLADVRVDLTVINDPPSVRDGFAARLSLATWPEQSPLLSAIALIPAQAGGPLSDTFTITTQGTVADGWYVVLVQGPGPDVTWGNPSYRHAISNDVSGVRVHKGQAPSVWSVDFCQKSATLVQVYVNLSERVVTMSDGALAPVSVGVSGRDCVATTTGPQSQPRPLYGFRCDGAALSEIYTVRLTEGMTSLSGVPVPPFDQSLIPDELDLGPQGCPAYKVAP